MTASEKLFTKYEYLAKHYANQLFNITRLALEKEDVVQEFRIKLYEVILSYGRSLGKHKKKGSKKPVPLPFYIKSSLSNFKNDFIKQIESNKSKICINNSEIQSYDYSNNQDSVLKIDTLNVIFEIDGYDLLYPLQGKQKLAFLLYCKGFEYEKLEKMFGKFFNVKKTILHHKKYLKENKEKFVPEKRQEIFVRNFIEEF